jgi:hypothetical protein
VGFVLVGASLVAAGALAGDVMRKDPAGDVKTAGLTQAERDALDLVSVRAIGDEDTGVVVVATFRGNVQKLLGLGHLKDAAVALLLYPKSAAQTPAALVTRGTARDAVLRKTRSADVGAVRSGNTVTFFVSGGGYSNVARLVVASYPSFVFRATRSFAQDAPPTISEADLAKLIRGRAADALSVLVDAGRFSCDELAKLQDLIEKRIARLPFRTTVARLTPILDKIRVRLGRPPCSGGGIVPAGELTLTFFDPTEVAGSGAFRGLGGRHVTQLFVRVPNRDVVGALCPSQLPVVARPAQDTLGCSGGGLSDGETFHLNVRTLPNPVAGMGGQLSGVLEDGTAIGPFSASGP